MRNDLARLQVRCVFRPQGCEVICALESVHRHEQQCDYALLNCSNAGTYKQAYIAISCYILGTGGLYTAARVSFIHIQYKRCCNSRLMSVVAAR